MESVSNIADGNKSLGYYQTLECTCGYKTKK